MFTDIRYIKKCIILFFVIILASIATSCTGMRPPGYHNTKYVVPVKNEKIEDFTENENMDNNSFALEEIKNFEKKVLSAKDDSIILPDETVAGEPIILEKENSPKEEYQNLSIKLSTLDEQMQNITNNQDKTYGKLSDIEQKVNSLDKRISKIENQLKKSANVTPIKSEEIKKNNSDYIIKSNENAKKAKTIKVNYNISKQLEPTQQNNVISIDENEKNKFEAGIKFFNAGKYSLAIQTLKEIKAESLSEISNPVYYYIAKSYFENKDYTSSLNYLNKVISSKKDEYKPEAQFLIAECYIKSGQADKAKLIYKDFVTNYPSSKFTPQARKMLQKL